LVAVFTHVLLGDHLKDVYGSRAQYDASVGEAIRNHEDCLVLCMDTADAFRTVIPKDIRRDKQLDGYVLCLIHMMLIHN
jgi:hypothetical protein